MKAKITGIGSYVPERVLSNSDLEKMVETSDEWIVTRTGIRERRIAGDDECSSDMGIRAAKGALEKAGLSGDQVDMIIVATSTPDYLFPSTAALIQSAIGANNAAVFDFQAACTGYLYGLSIAKTFVESGVYKNVLLVATEKLSSFVDYKDRSTCILFGDGAAATLISAEGEGLAIEHVHLGANGDEAMLLTLPGGGARIPASEQSLQAGKHFLKMEGREVFKHGVRRMVQTSEECLEKLSLKADDITWLIPHQANIRIIESVAKRLGFPMERIYLTVQKYGNTSASSVPIAMHEMLEQHSMQPGERLLLTSFGAGLTWGSAVLRWTS